MVAALSGSTFEYTHFTFQGWYPGDNWNSLDDGDRHLRPQARYYFWENYESRITAELQKWQAQGWIPVEEIGASAIKLRRYVNTDQHIDPADVLLWFMTLGLALVMQILFVRTRHYVSYVPVEFRVKMRRPVESQVAAHGEPLYTR
jgi:hypothetical protein